MNPGTVDREKLEVYKACGINRLSIGMQSVKDENLKVLGRIHNFEQLLEAYQLSREAGFTNINLDLMSSLPSQTKEKWEEALTIWQSIYQAQTNKKLKAEAAANIAVGYEMVGKFNEALDWAKKSLALFKEQTSDEKDSNVALLTLYEQVITSRIQANNKLNMQFGKE